MVLYSIPAIYGLIPEDFDTVILVHFFSFQLIANLFLCIFFKE